MDCPRYRRVWILYLLPCPREACRALNERAGFDSVTSIDFKVHDAAANRIILQVESVFTWVTKQRTSISALDTESL